jgi:hypothetical protein
MAAQKINLGEMLARELKNSNINYKVLAERINRDPTTVQLMLTKDNMSVERLMACTKALNYNFFLEIGYKIACPGPADPKGNPLTARVNQLEQDVKDKELKITGLQTELQKVISEADIQKRLLETEINTVKMMMKELFAARQPEI